MEVWRRRGEAASAGLSAALYSVYHGLYSEAVVFSVTSAVALAEVGRFREAVQYVQKAAKALYEGAREVFERVKVAVQRLVELFVEAVTRVLAWVDEHKAYLFLMAAGAVALSAALNMRGMIELEKLAYAASLTPFIPAGVREYSREEVFNMLKGPDPYEKFKEIAKAAIAKNEKLPQPWESLRVLIMPKPSEERLMRGKAYSKLDEGKKKALFYAALALEEALGVYRSALRKYAEERGEVVEKREVGEGPFKRVMYVVDLGRLRRLAEEESKAFEDALKVLRERLNEYAVKYGLRDLLDVKEGVARELAEAEHAELPEFGGVNFGTKAYAALIANREYALGRRGALGAAAEYWLEVGGSARLLYYAPWTAYIKAEKAKTERPAAVEEMVAEALRRLFLKPGADHYSRFIKELKEGGKLALMLENEAESSYMFKLYNMKEGSKLDELGIELWISKVGEGEEAGITYTLVFKVKRWREFFEQKLETGMKAAEEVGERLPVEDRLPYMLGWVNSDVAITRMKKKGERMLEMGTSHLWQLAETHALFNWSDIVVSRVGLTLEGSKPQFRARTSLGELDRAIKKSAEDGWLKMLGIKAESWDGLKEWVAENWSVVVDAAVKRLGEEIRGELEALRNKLNDDKVSRDVAAPALLLIQAERLGVDETTLRYFAAVASGAIGGDGHVSAAMKRIELISGEREIALLWAAALAAHGIETKVRRVGNTPRVLVSGGGAVRLASLCFLYGGPLLEGDEKVINHKLAEAVKLVAEGLSVSWEGLRLTKSGVAADLTISEAGVVVKYNIYLRDRAIELELQSTDQVRAELAARLLRLAGVSAEVRKRKDRDVWYVKAATDRLAAGHENLRKALAEIVRRAVENGWVEAGKAEGWLEKLERGRVLKEGWPKYLVRLARSGALVVSFSSTSPDSVKQEAQRLRDMGLEEGKHFVTKMPESGRKGYVSILKEGLACAAWLSVHGSERQQGLAAEFVEYILQRAWEAGREVYEKAKEIVKEGKARSSLKLEGFEKRVEVDGRMHVVKVIGGGAGLEEKQGGRKLLRIWITAEVDGVRCDYEITYGRYGRKNAAIGFAVARADASGGREEEAERLSALIKALTGREPSIRRMKDGTIVIECYGGHLEGLMRFAELAGVIARWLEETSR
ncbi:MAG: hypothetical protein ACO2PN_11505 [Pyrobaculum sp.]|jgi:23S rRNA pseudoU1915 N3-methylase RlmH